jgi:hypothetical protein
VKEFGVAARSLTEYEYAFYTAVANNDSAKELITGEAPRTGGGPHRARAPERSVVVAGFLDLGFAPISS